MQFLRENKWMVAFAVVFVLFVLALVFIWNITIGAAIGIAVLASFVAGMWIVIPALLNGLWS